MNDYDYSVVSFFLFSFPPLHTHSASSLSLSHTHSDWVALKYLIIVDGNWHHWFGFPVMVELLWTNYTKETMAAISIRIWASNIAYLNFCENVTVLKCFDRVEDNKSSIYIKKQKQNKKQLDQHSVRIICARWQNNMICITCFKQKRSLG